MNRRWLLTVGLFFAIGAMVSGSAGAADLVLAEGGETNYQIVLPDNSPDQAIADSLAQTARLMQAAFRESGFDLPVATESERDPSRSAIYLGGTRFARSQGVDTSSFDGWEYVHKAVGRDLIIAGNDHAPPEITEEGYERFTLFYRISTLKGVTDFLGEYTDTHVLYPGSTVLPSTRSRRVPEWEIGDTAEIEYGKKDRIAVPEDLDVRWSSWVNYNFRGSRSCALYDIANNLFPRVDDAPGAHTHEKAVPPEKYRESNPEMFALIGGERYKGVQYCISNRQFQDLVYQWTRQWFGMGFKSASILQSDGFRPCQCDECHALYGTGSDWSEKMWIFHRKIGERLLEDYPDRAFYITSYTVTGSPPKSFKKFPANTGIGVQGADENHLESFQGWEVPQGFRCGIHNWIANLATRYTPMRTPLFIERQVKKFHASNIASVGRDGIGSIYGLEGPTQYIYGRMFDDPEGLSAKDLMLEFCGAAFGEAGAPMRRFYDRLNHAIELYSLYLGTHGAGWSYRDIYGRRHKHVQDPFRFIGFLYSPSILEGLNKDLSEAESRAKAPKVKTRLALARRELEYIRALAMVIHLHQAYQMKPDLASRERLLDAIDDRNELIASYFYQEGRFEGRTKPVPGWQRTLFPPPGHGYSHLKLANNGYQEPMKDTPLNWDTDAMRKAPLPGSETIAFGVASEHPGIGAPAWDRAAAAELKAIGNESEQGTAFRVLRDDANLYILVETDLSDADATGGDFTSREAIDVYLAPLPGKEIYYRFKVGPRREDKWDAARGLITDTMNLSYNKDDPEWAGEWKYDVRRTGGRWTALITVPFKTMGAEVPDPGTAWRANVGRIHAADGRIVRSIWSTLGATEDVGDRNALGELVFEKPGQSSASGKHPSAVWREGYYADSFDIPPDWKKINNPKPVALGPWLFRPDALERGLPERWFAAEANTDDWKPVAVPAFWHESGFERFGGYAWYRTTFETPAEWRGRPYEVLFGSVDEQAWVYVNGELVREHSVESEKKTIGALWETPFAARVEPENLNYGGENVLVVRVHNSAASGGLWRAVLGHPLGE